MHTRGRAEALVGGVTTAFDLGRVLEELWGRVLRNETDCEGCPGGAYDFELEGMRMGQRDAWYVDEDSQ